MFEIENKKVNVITIKTANKSIDIDLNESKISAGLTVGDIYGPGEYEIADVSIKAIPVKNDRVIYDVVVSEVKIGVIGDIEDGLDELSVSDILCTSSVRAVREIGPKVIIATGNVDGMVSELKLTAKVDKKYKVKKADSLPVAQEVVALN